MQLGSPEVGYHSFWDVYKEVRGAVDSDFLFQTGMGVIDEDARDECEGPESDAHQRPLQHLQPCEFGRDGIPPVVHEGEIDLVTSFLPTIFLICYLPSEEPEYSARLSDGAPGTVVSKFGFYTCADLFWKTISWLSSQTRRKTRYFDSSEEPHLPCHVHNCRC